MAEDAPGSDPADALASARVMVNVVTFYQRVHLRLFADHIEADWPVPLLGILPVRRASRTVKLADLEAIRLVPVVFPGRLAIMAALALTPIVIDLPLWSAMALLVASVLFLLLGVVNAIRIIDRHGSETIPVCWLQRSRARNFIDRVRRATTARGTS